MIFPHPLRRPQRASGRPASSKAPTSHQRLRSRAPPLQRRPNAASPRTAAATEDEPSLFTWNRARTIVLPNYLISAGICTPVFFASSSSKSSVNLPPLAYSMYRGEGDVVDADPLPLLLGDGVSDGVAGQPGRLEYHASALQEIL